MPERRTAGYEIFDVRYNTKWTEPLEQVTQIRQRVKEWRAINERGGFGVFCWDVAFLPAQMQDILAKYSTP